jgi:hypothetical protein
MKALFASLFAALFAFAALSAHAATPLGANAADMSSQPQSAPSADEDDKDKDKDKDGGKKPD